jgi:hypothetical protein
MVEKQIALLRLFVGDSEVFISLDMQAIAQAGES